MMLSLPWLSISQGLLDGRSGSWCGPSFCWANCRSVRCTSSFWCMHAFWAKPPFPARENTGLQGCLCVACLLVS
ncbi:uncharacterized protein BO97DRAFT_162078 [Aspergillus homomorphus CBS 101889]|uniref:Uncharacterized protein n=1 Tax=Aspergillus homomorphus (strain CBS 101889) TaxID=1450537 RepID=A0A395HP94_ASPHC|nr:hypothetical protein BO97DRAFT_162078 [Aspergillus homomorphus CBS 101889]RAL09637.1 hypothetical protein BO97DRAFT_162078 [Aspergillus homomorphus CBS 101889]